MSHFLGGDFYRKYFVKNPKIISPFFYVNFLNFLAHSGSDDNFLVGIIIEHSFTSLSTKSTREIRNCITALHLLINIYILLNMFMYISIYPQKQLLLHLQQLLQHPVAVTEQKQMIETLDYFMQRLSSQQTHQRLQALKGLKLVLSPIGKVLY